MSALLDVAATPTIRAKKRANDGVGSIAVRRTRRKVTTRNDQAISAGGSQAITFSGIVIPGVVLLRVFTYFEPSDLLHLAWTSKILRGLLMSRSSSFVWECARENMPKMPKCPRYLSEPEFAYRIFENDCHFCGKSGLPSEYWQWEIQLRSCEKCFGKKKYFTRADWCQFLEGFPEKLKDLLSFELDKRTLTRCMTTARKCASPPYRKTYYVSVQRKELWEEEYMKAGGSEEWLEEKVESEARKIRQGSEWWRWFVDLDSLRQAKIEKDRRAVVINHIREMGWGDEHAKISNKWDRPEQKEEIKMACENPITSTVLSRLEPFINKYMDGIKAERLTGERKGVLIPFLKKKLPIYDTFFLSLSTDSPYPPICEILQDPMVRRIIEKELDAPASSNLDWVSTFRGVTGRWQRRTECTLELLTAEACSEDKKGLFDRGMVLDLATTWFSCTKCNSVMRHPRVLVHGCATSGCVRIDRSDAYVLAVDALVHRSLYNSQGCIQLQRHNYTFMTQVVQLCGLDPKITTAQEMDAMNPVIECLTCNDPRNGRTVMLWRRVLTHLRDERHKEVDAKLDLVSEADKHIVLERMSEIQTRQKHQPGNQGLRCRHCRVEGNIVDLIKHVEETHEKPNPTDDDIVTLLDADHVPPVYVLWPPRASR
ncbi:hypothetical protein CVT26_005938 [Gymnopilus dilepis]|uniref:F-box domain-containing protein n=1 Tax=Gymnopilus dilepis TaxID=231916 RepID=A0A409Y1K7_9AGAR|nr:hypothetical protein CVT26_005938 [Gymnopilus dilepis]